MKIMSVMIYENFNTELSDYIKRNKSISRDVITQVTKLLNDNNFEVLGVHLGKNEISKNIYIIADINNVKDAWEYYGCKNGVSKLLGYSISQAIVNFYLTNHF